MISFLYALIIQSKVSFAIFWICIPIFLISSVLLLLYWNSERLKADVNKSNTIIRGFMDLTTAILVLSGLFYLAIVFLEMINESISQNIYVVIIVFDLMFISQLFNRLAIINAKKETSRV